MSVPPVLIGLCGWSRAGKDSVADILVEDFGFRRFAFADALRNVLLEVCKVLDPTMAGQVQTHGWESLKPIMRETTDAMIALGQGMRDHVDPDVWTRALPVIGEGERLVISDIRQANEVALLHARGGELWRIKRAETVPRAMDQLIEDVPVSVLIFNDGTLADLRYLVGQRIQQAIGYG